MRYQQHQPTMIQPNPDQSNSRLPIRLASSKKSCHRWTQQRKAPPDPTPSVPVDAQPDRPVKVKFNVGDVIDELPASAVGQQAECIPVDSTGSNPEDHGEFPSVSPVVPVSDVRLMRPEADRISASISQAGEPIPRIVRADIGMSASNRDRRPDDDSPVYHSVNEEIYGTVRVEQTHSDVPVSHNDETRNDVHAGKDCNGVWIRRPRVELVRQLRSSCTHVSCGVAQQAPDPPYLTYPRSRSRLVSTTT